MSGRKRALAALLVAAVMILSCGTAAEENVLYESAFSGRDTDGWYTEGGDTLAVTAQGTLSVRNRKEDWHGPRRDFPLEPGTEYTISVEVMQKQEPKTYFMVSVGHERNGQTTYENLCEVYADRGVWTPMTFFWTPGNYHSFTLYVETLDSPKVNFEIRNFRVSTGTAQGDLFIEQWNERVGEKLPELTESMRNTAWPAFMTLPGGGAEAWLPAVEIPQWTPMKEYRIEDGVLTVTMEKPVREIDIIDYDNNYEDFRTYHSDEDTQNPDRGLTASIVLNSPLWDHVQVITTDVIEENGIEYRWGIEYEYVIRTHTLEHVMSSVTYPLSLKDYPPYDGISGAEGQICIQYQPDGSVMSVEYRFTVSEVLAGSIHLDEEGRLEGTRIYRYGFCPEMDLNVELSTGTDGKVKDFSITMLDTQVHATVITPEQFVWNYDAIRSAYPKAKPKAPGLKVWNYSFGMGELFFATRDDLFTIDEQGYVTVNEDARDLNGEPFNGGWMTELVDAEFLRVPVI